MRVLSFTVTCDLAVFLHKKSDFAHFDIRRVENKVDGVDERNFGFLFQHLLCQNSVVRHS